MKDSHTTSSRNDDGVTVVVPVRDEANSIATALDSLAAQTIGPESLEVLVYDGMSTDGTAEIARSFGAPFPWRRFEVFENRKRTVPHALNAGLVASTCLWFVRLDGRLHLSANYIEACIAYLEGSGPMAAAGGRLVAEAHGPTANAIAAAVTHSLGVGHGFRTAKGGREELPHHPFAVWRTEEIRALGGFNLELVRNQDDEFSLRATKRGARIVLIPAAEAIYRPRERLVGLAAQYFQYGLWKAVVARRYALFPLRSAAPAAVMLVACFAAVSAARGRSRWPALGLAALYGGLGVVVSRDRPGADPLLTGGALAIVHLTYGAGVIAGALRPSLGSTKLGRARVR